MPARVRCRLEFDAGYLAEVQNQRTEITFNHPLVSAVVDPTISGWPGQL
jgi:hypothetical protein